MAERPGEVVKLCLIAGTNQLLSTVSVASINLMLKRSHFQMNLLAYELVNHNSGLY